MGTTHNKLYLLAPIWYPTIGFLVCLTTLFLASGLQDISGNAILAFNFGTRGLFQLTMIAGVVVALVEWFFQENRKTAFFLFCTFAVGAAFFGWIFAQSIIHF